MEASRKGPGENRPKSSLEAEIVMCGPRLTGQGCLSAEGVAGARISNDVLGLTPNQQCHWVMMTQSRWSLLCFFLSSFFSFLFYLTKKIFIRLRRVLVAWHRLFHMSTRASLVALCGFNCLPTCGILVPGPGIEPTCPALDGGFLTTGPAGESLFF